MNSKVFFIFLTLFFYNSQLFCAEFPEIKGLDEEARGDVKKSSEPEILEEKESGIWVQLGDYKTVIQIPYEVSRLSNFLRAGLLDLPEKERSENSQSNPFPLPSINEKEFKLFLNIAEFLILVEKKPELKERTFKLLINNLKQPRMVQSILQKNLEIEDIGQLYYLSIFLDIPVLTEFILKNIAQLCLLDENCLDKLLKNLDGSPFNVINEKSFKNELLQKNPWLQKVLSEPFILGKEIKSDKFLLIDRTKFSDHKYHLGIRQFGRDIWLNDNFSFFASQNGEIVIENITVIKNITTRTFKTIKTPINEPLIDISISGDRNWLAILQGHNIMVYRISISSDKKEISLEHTYKIPIIDIDLQNKKKLIFLNSDGNKLFILESHPQEHLLIIYDKINNEWRFNSKLKLPKENVSSYYTKKFILDPINENALSIFVFIHPIEGFILKFQYIIYLANPEQNKKLSINQLILLLVLNELNETQSGKKIINKNREKIFEALKQYPINIQHQIISTEYGFSDNEINKLEKGVL